MPRIDRREFLVVSGATVSLAALASAWASDETGRLRVVGLKVDYLDRPLGLENQRPRLSWRLEADERNVQQSAYRILVASSEAELRAGRGDLWDSGKVNLRKSLGIEYQGRALRSRQRCWWAVQVWDKKKRISKVSEASWWEMGLLEPQDWTAQWLAVEDPVGRADREAGLHWIWGGDEKRSKRRFRFRLRLPADASSGELYAVVNDWLWTAQVSGVWVDGRVVQGDPDRRSSHNWALETDNLSAQRLALGPLGAGEHVLAVEVDASALAASMTPGFAFSGRFNLVNGEILRIGSETEWKTSLVEDRDWPAPEYDDQAWEETRPVDLGDFQPLPPQPAMHLRREFTLGKPVAKARLYATALGAYEARLNGRRVGDALLTPEISQYAKRVLYQVYDVTGMLQTGENALGLTVGDGWYASWEGRYSWGPPPRRVLAQLELTFADGSREVVATGAGWRTVESPIRCSEIRAGECYDARLEQPGWDKAGFDDSSWPGAVVAARPACGLVAQVMPPIRATQVLKPRAITEPHPGVYVFDFGQCFAGWCRLRARGERGTRIELRFGELLTPAGEVYYDRIEMGEPKIDRFILRGETAGETFEPHFTRRGFRYVQVTGLATAPTAQSLEGVFVHSDLAMTGRLRIDNPLIEQIWRNVVWTQRSNTWGYFTDCSCREQRGWMADAGLFWDAAAFNMDVCAFTSRQMNNVADNHPADGTLPATAAEPHHSNSMFQDGAWYIFADGSVILPWTVWRRYGDLAIIERNWEMMNRYVQFILDHNPDYLWRKGRRGLDIGDWLGLGERIPGSSLPVTPTDLIATAYWAHSTDLLAQMSEAIGRAKDAARLRMLLRNIRQAFSETFVKADGTVGNGTQTSYILALQFGLLPPSLRQAVVERLAADIRQRGISLTTGLVGTAFVLDVLAEGGFTDLAYGLLLRTEFPSWGYMIRQGATAMWEDWRGNCQFNDKIYKTSQNQAALGSICGFLFRRVVGIDAVSPGFENIAIRPVFDPRVKRGGGDYDSIMGRISTDWEQFNNGGFKLDITIPANTTARVHLPARSGSRIEEGGREITRCHDLRVLKRLDQETVVEVGSGIYQLMVAG